METPEETGHHPNRGKVIAALLLILVIGGFGYYTFGPARTGGQQVRASVDVLDARLQNLENSTMLHEKRLAKLEDDTEKLAAAKPASPTGAATASPADDKRIVALEKEIASLKAEKPMENREEIASAIRLLSAFHRFSDKVLSGRPYATELVSLQAVLAEDDALTKLLGAFASFADNGVPTLAQLLASFDQSVDQFNSAESVPPASAGWWERFTYNLRHLVKVRRIDDTQTGTTPEAIVARASAHLEREEIEEAFSEIKSLPENLRPNFSEWMEEAQAYIAAPVLVDKLEEGVMKKAFNAEDEPAPAAKPQEQ